MACTHKNGDIGDSGMVYQFEFTTLFAIHSDHSDHSDPLFLPQGILSGCRSWGQWTLQDHPATSLRCRQPRDCSCLVSSRVHCVSQKHRKVMERAKGMRSLWPIPDFWASLSMGFLKWGYPKFIVHFIFWKKHEINSPAIGVPRWKAGNLHVRCVTIPAFMSWRPCKRCRCHTDGLGTQSWGSAKRALARCFQWTSVVSGNLMTSHHHVQPGIISSIFVNIPPYWIILVHIVISHHVQVDKAHMKNGDTRWLVNCRRTQPHQLAIHRCIVL